MSATRSRIHADGVTLHVESEGAGPPVLLLHGFTGSTQSMGGIAAGLTDQFRVHRVDLVGHGASDAPNDVSLYRMDRCVAQVAVAIEALGAYPAHVIGYSMGARVALALCAWRAEHVASATLIGARAGISDSAAREQRVRGDEALATRIEREGVANFVDHWMALPLFASQKRLGEEALAAARQERLANSAHGLACSLRGMGVGAQPVLDSALPTIDVPLCLVVGEEDRRFGEVADSLALALPHADVVRIPEAGHAAHLENSTAFLAVVHRFLAENSGESQPTRNESRTFFTSTP